MPVEVEPTRIGALGVGTFLILTCGVLYTLLCLAGSLMARPGRMYVSITAIYGALLIFLTNAKRRSRWEIPNDALQDVDNLWLIHILVGTVLVIGCIFAFLAYVRYDLLSVVVAKEIDTERDRRPYGRERFMFSD